MKTILILATLALTLSLLLPARPLLAGSPLPPPPRPTPPLPVVTPPAPQDGAHKEHEHEHEAGGVVVTVEATRATWNPLDVWYQLPPR